MNCAAQVLISGVVESSTNMSGLPVYQELLALY